LAVTMTIAAVVAEVPRKSVNGGLRIECRSSAHRQCHGPAASAIVASPDLNETVGERVLPDR
jgi:hypothetical protein